MRSRKIPVIFILMAVWLQGCGFTPIYATDQPYGFLLASIRIETQDDRIGQLLRIHLEDLFNPESTSVEKRYKLIAQAGYNVKIKAIDPDGTAARYALEVVSNYAFHPLDNAEQMTRGTIRRDVSYNVSEDQDYATFIAEQDALKRAIKEVAEAYKAEMAALLARGY